MSRSVNSSEQLKLPKGSFAKFPVIVPEQSAYIRKNESSAGLYQSLLRIGMATPYRCVDGCAFVDGLAPSLHSLGERERCACGKLGELSG